MSPTVADAPPSGPATYRNERPYPFCRGCGHGPILDAVDGALVSLGLDPSEVVVVTDIGCSGLSDQYFKTSAFHGLHGRSLTYATGIKLARPDLKVVVLMGDGGAGIGGAHLLNAARRNVGLTLVVMNNLNFGMTGGQHSVTTPTGAITATTPDGNLERPLDLCATAAVNGAGYVWRGTSFDRDLPERIAEAIRAECFALLDVWELCTAHFVPANRANRRSLHETIERLGFGTGLVRRAEVPEYAAAYRAAGAPHRGEPTAAPAPLEPRFESVLERRFGLVVAGSAGGRVRSAARTVARAALLAGLHATQRDDYPITVKSGHSVSELVLAPGEIHWSGLARPDALVLLSTDGLAQVRRPLARMGSDADLFVLPALARVEACVETGARVHVVDPGRTPAPAVALYALATAVRALDLVPPEALEAAAAVGSSERREETLRVLRSVRA